MSLYKNIILVIISPRVGWDAVNQAGVDSNKLLAKVFFPMLAILAVSAFIPRIYDTTLETTTLFTSVVLQCAAFFFDYYIASYLLGGFYPEVTKTAAGQSRLNSYIIHILTYLMLLNIVSNVMPIDFTPVLFLMVYAIWIAYQGTDFLGVKTEKKPKFVLIASALMLIAPIFINFIK